MIYYHNSNLYLFEALIIVDKSRNARKFDKLNTRVNHIYTTKDLVEKFVETVITAETVFLEETAASSRPWQRTWS
jgi:hypothetical protein